MMTRFQPDHRPVRANVVDERRRGTNAQFPAAVVLPSHQRVPITLATTHHSIPGTVGLHRPNDVKTGLSPRGAKLTCQGDGLRDVNFARGKLAERLTTRSVRLAQMILIQAIRNELGSQGLN